MDNKQRDADRSGRVTCTVDLDKIRFHVPKENGLFEFATRISEAMEKCTGSCITPSQVQDTLVDMRHLGEMVHRKLDMNFVPDEEFAMQNVHGYDADIDYTLQGWRDVCRSCNMECIIDPAWLDQTKKMWRDADFALNTNSFACNNWPFEVPEDGSGETVSTPIIANHSRESGIIMLSTVFITQASQPEYINQFDKALSEALEMTTTTSRMIAREYGDMMEMQPEFPYLCPTDRVKWGNNHPVLHNQDYINQRLCNHVQPTSSNREYVEISRNVPLDLQAQFCGQRSFPKNTQKYCRQHTNSWHRILLDYPVVVLRTTDSSKHAKNLRSWCRPGVF